MKKLAFVVVCGFAFSLAAAGPLQAQEKKGIGESIGERVDRAIGEIGEELREGFAKARQAVDRLNVVGRVYARVHWDKSLHDADIAVAVADNRTATLTGTVSSEAAKRKAEVLAADTVGVDRVVNHLKVVETPPK